MLRGRGAFLCIVSTLLVLGVINISKMDGDQSTQSLKYSPTDTPVVIGAALREISTQDAQTTPQVCISVQDAGPGIPPAESPLLFQKFVRLHRDLSGTVRGTGLGLYLSKRFVEAMGGRIWVESTGTAGQGSCFYFTLPITT